MSRDQDCGVAVRVCFVRGRSAHCVVETTLRTPDVGKSVCGVLLGVCVCVFCC